MKISSGRFLVTGGASFIGSHIVDALLAEGASEVRVFDNLSLGQVTNISGALGRGDGRCVFIRGDVLRSDDLLDAVDGVDGVFHTAGIVTRPLADHAEQGLDVNVRGTSAVLAAARLAGAKKVVLSSSVSIYGAAHGAQIAEDTAFQHGGLGVPSRLYGGSKILAEALCRLHYERHGLDYVALRYPTVYGERQHRHGVNTELMVTAWRAIGRGEPPRVKGDGSQARDYTYVADVASANLSAMTSEVSGEAFNVSTGVSTSELDMVRLLLRLAHSDLEPVFEPGEDDGPRIVNAPVLSYSPARASASLGWRAQVSLEDGISRLVASLNDDLRSHAS